jgi:hypothetical protein
MSDGAFTTRGTNVVPRSNSVRTELRRWFAACLTVALTAAAACAPERQYSEPPAASYSPKRFALMDENGTSAGVDGAEVYPEFFAAPQVLPIIGRLFTDAEYRPNAAPAMLVSHRCWEERFGSQLDLLGRAVTLDGRERIVVGVLPPRFDFPKGACVWVPGTI